MHSPVSENIWPLGNVWQRDDRYTFFLGTMVWVLVILMIVPDGFDYQSLNASSAPSSGGLVSRLLWIVLLLVGIFVLSWRAGLAWLLTRALNPFFWLFAVLALASIIWSIDSSLTIRRLVRMLTFILMATAFVLIAWHRWRFQSVIRPILTLVLIGSIIFVLLQPTLAIHQETAPELLGAWRGLANHKNGLGALACFSAIFWLHAGLTREVKPLSAIIGCTIALICLLFSRSSTSMAATAVVFIFLFLLLRSPPGLRPYMPYVVTGLTVIVLGYALAILDLIPGLGALLAPITQLTGKDMSLTGRVEIWAILADHIAEHPFLGTGYGAYWTAGPVVGTDAYAFMSRMNGFFPGSAHNGYLEIINDLGWIGFGALLGYIVFYVRQSLQLFVFDYQQAVLYLALFFQQAITNLSESHWFSVLSIDFVIMALATTALARGLLEQQLRTAFGEPSNASAKPPSPPIKRSPPRPSQLLTPTQVTASGQGGRL